MSSRFAVLSIALPPSWSGQAMVWSRLLQGLEPSRYCLIDTGGEATVGGADGFLPGLPGKRHPIPPACQWRRGVRFGIHRVRSQVNHLLRMADLVPRAWRIASILRAEHCDTLVASTGDLVDLPAACLASRWAGTRLFVYVFDYYSHQPIEALPRLFAHLAERHVLQRADGVIVPNEHVGQALRRRYGIATTLVRNPCDLAEYLRPLAAGAPAGEEGPRIVYTGAIYQAQLDAFQSLLTALPRARRQDLRLHVWTAIEEEAIARMGIQGPVVVHPHQPTATVAAVQRAADILFLPLAFDSPYDPEIIRTSAPGKTGEYLAAGRPILVHAPPDSFLAWYFRKHRCGWVVDRKDPAALAGAIDRLLEDDALRLELVTNARERAVRDFDVEVARRTFLRALGVQPSMGDGG